MIAGGEKFLHNRDQTGVTLAWKIALGLGAQLVAVHGKQREIGLGAADIARENEISMSHGSLLTTKDTKSTKPGTNNIRTLRDLRGELEFFLASTAGASAGPRAP
jgi:hypothetical protein